MATYNGNNTVDVTKLAKGDVITFAYTGASKNITLPAGTYKLQVWGAQGGTYNSYTGGAGGYSVGTITLSTPTTVYAYVGGQPTTNSTQPAQTAGGFNGGGAGYNRSYSGTYSYGQGGGGATDFRIGGETLYHRVIVAGGGGGSSSVAALTTKYGGGTNGGSPQSGYGASQTAAGTNGGFGTGGAATTSGGNYKYGSGGGGGGWYGGGACSSYSDTSNYQGYNGGGSGFVWTGQTVPAAYQLGAEYQLTDAATYAGNTSIPSTSGSSETGHQGNGYAQIAVVALQSKGCEVYIKKSDELILMGGGEAPFVRLNSSYEWENSGFTGVSFVKKGGNHWLFGAKGADIQSSNQTFLCYTDDINNPQWTQIDIGMSDSDTDGYFSGQIVNVYDADYHDGMWVIVADAYNEVESENKIVLAWAFDEDIENWYFIKSFSYIEGKSEINNRVFYFENAALRSGQWTACIYNLNGGLFVSGDDPTDGTSWVQASMADSQQLFPGYCYSVSATDMNFFAATPSGVLYTSGGFDQFQTTDVTTPTKKIFHIQVSGANLSYIITENGILFSETATSDFNTLVVPGSLTIYDAIYHNRWILVATSLGIIGIYDEEISDEGIYTDSAVTLVAASGNECVFLTENQELMKFHFTDSGDVETFSTPTMLAETGTTDTFSFINYEINSKWIPATAVYKKVNGAWKKADSVLLKTDGMWEPSNVTPYEIELPFNVTCKNCSATDKFTFQLKDSNDSVVDTVNCTGAEISATFYFKKLSFKKAGTFTYSVSQVAGTDAYMFYESSHCVVVLTLEFDSSNNSIVCSNVVVTKNGNLQEAISFNNSKSTQIEPDPS